jgi:predicted dehydrogenase
MQTEAYMRARSIKMTAKKQMGAALIGYGPAFNMGRLHGQSLQEQAGIPVVAVCDTDRKRLAAAQEDFPGIATYTQVSELLQDDKVNLCVIILPHNLHGPVGLQCLKAGRHVVLEKPMCITTAEAKAMVDTAKANKLMLTVFHNRRHDGDFLALKKAVADGLLGEIFEVEMWAGGYGAPRGWWRDKKEISGGAFYDWGAHYLDWLLNLIPSPVENVTGFFHKLVWKQMTNEDHVQAVIRFQNGVMANVQMSGIAHHSLPRWRVLGTKGALVSGTEGFEYYTTENSLHLEGFLKYQESNWGEFYRLVGEHLLKDGELEVKPEEAARVIGIIESAEKSSQSHKAEKLPKWLQ